ncbi:MULTISPECIES: tetratricopeptide repeat protein [unclassified Burkholderia]|uniref:tetratricopeptide repeat protein n=1 Tax=unclassified Burkholderia TaxID=2613784 RepID=UPI002AB2B81B|nr:MULTISPECIES: tetratricopeptide repeat protein [unclassified Burkholderia]
MTSTATIGKTDEGGYPFDLGTYSRKISTDSEDAQRWFDRGLNWCFGYNHNEAIVCFQRAAEFDPTCAMIQWGIAYAAGPNYNLPWDFFTEQQQRDTLEMCLAALDRAEELKAGAKPFEQDLIAALFKRYQSREPVLLPQLYAWAGEYAEAMGECYKKYPDDLDAICFYGEAMMNKSPWRLWDPVSGKPIEGADTLQIKEVLEHGINVGRATEIVHPGVWHLYIHTMEMSPTPEIALRIGDELRHLVPDAGHLAHMPTHIDVQCGNYLDVVVSNQAGIERDMKFYHYAGAKNFYSLYRCHNYHFKLYGAMFLGQYEPAINAAREMQRSVGDQVMTADMAAMQGWFEAYMSLKTHAFVRFGKWQECIDEPLPENQEMYKMTTAMTWYGRAIGYANLKQDAKAREAQAEFLKAVKLVPETQVLHVIPCHLILAVGVEMLAGEIEYNAGNIEKGLDHLRVAVKLEDALPYDEPWPWMMPCRHALGALLLEQGHLEEAIEAYEADLGMSDAVVRANRHPNNVWALLGLYSAYRRAGRLNDARKIKPQMDFALARADKSIHASCFCSKKKAA